MRYDLRRSRSLESMKAAYIPLMAPPGSTVRRILKAAYGAIADSGVFMSSRPSGLPVMAQV
jgi:hypothetical protein